ncbi:MAG: hypothetical protein RR565_11095 [Erysipelothrix sp.]
MRVYDGVNTDLPGGWVMRADDIKGLTPLQIQEKYALPFEPVYVGEAIIPAGSKINIGIANELFGYPGGGIQIDLNYDRVGEFKELGEILKWNLE